MAGADSLLVALLKLAGRSPKDLEVYAEAFENRLRDVRALTRGGTMSDGIATPGLGDLFRRVDHLTRQVELVLRHLPVQAAGFQRLTVQDEPAESSAESSGGNPHPQQE